MKITKSTIQQLTITDAPMPANRGILDPVRVQIEDIGPGKGRINITCYTEAWTAYWGAMGDNTLAEFFVSCDEHYLAGNLDYGRSTEVFSIEALDKKLCETIIQRRRNRWHQDHINQETARDLWIDIELYVHGQDCVNDVNADLLRRILGEDYWNIASDCTKPSPRYNYLCTIIKTVQQALKSLQPRQTPARLARIDRVKHANALIHIISEHGRRFFWNEKDRRVASIGIDHRGKLWWTDDYRGTRVCIEKIGGYEHRWHGFSHGGTLKQLVQMMREYIKTGERISIGHICPGRWEPDNGNIWGYSPEAAQACRAAASQLDIIIH